MSTESAISTQDTYDLPDEDVTESLTPLELHVFLLLWQGIPQHNIAKTINRSQRQVTRLVKRITGKIRRFDMSLLLYRLETELFMRVPRMTTSELIKALNIYHRHASPTQSTSSLPGKPEPKMTLKLLMQSLFQDNNTSQESNES